MFCDQAGVAWEQCLKMVLLHLLLLLLMLSFIVLLMLMLMLQVLRMLQSKKGDLVMLRDQAGVAWEQCLKHFGETKQSCSSDTDFWADIKVFGGGGAGGGGAGPL